jgi:hypothetical protein
MNYENPQQSVISLENILFFSNFDSGNMSNAEKVGNNSVNLM